jgi:hypothetical protein
MTKNLLNLISMGLLPSMLARVWRSWLHGMLRLLKLKSKISSLCWLVFKDSRVQQGAYWQGRSLWHSSFRDASNHHNLEFPSYGLTLAWPILLECLPRIRRKRISTRGLDFWLFLLRRWKFCLVELLFWLHSPLTRGTRLTTWNILFFCCLFVLHVVDVLLAEPIAGPSIFDFTSSSS